MFHFLGFLFIIIIAILLIGLSIIGTVIRTLFGFGGRYPKNGYRNTHAAPRSGGEHSFDDGNQSGYTPNENTGTSGRSTSSHSRHQKLFAPDEGEYVDFEEIKEE